MDDNMIWTKVTPSKEGYYWYKDYSETPIILQIYKERSLWVILLGKEILDRFEILEDFGIGTSWWSDKPIKEPSNGR